MKRTFSILLAFILLYSTIGFTFATHYCGGKLFGTRIVTDVHHDPCGCPPMEEDDDCCKDEITQLKIKNDFVGSFASSVISEQIILTSVISNFQFKISNLKPEIRNYFKPPLIFSISILNCSLRF